MSVTGAAAEDAADDELEAGADELGADDELAAGAVVGATAGAHAATAMSSSARTRNAKLFLNIQSPPLDEFIERVGVALDWL